jgi:hypothetical protein
MKGNSSLADSFHLAALGSCMGTWWIKGQSMIAANITKNLANERKAKVCILAATICFLTCRRSNPIRATAMLVWWTSHACYGFLHWSKSVWNTYLCSSENKRGQSKRKNKELQHLALLINDDTCVDPARFLGLALHWAGMSGAKFVTIYDACGKSPVWCTCRHFS